MEIIPFPNKNRNTEEIQESITLTQSEYDRLLDLKRLLPNSISPSEARYYKNEIEALNTVGTIRRNTVVNPDDNTYVFFVNRQNISLAQDEYGRFIELIKLLAASISPGEATYYKNELEGLIVVGKNRRNI